MMMMNDIEKERKGLFNKRKKYRMMMMIEIEENFAQIELCCSSLTTINAALKE